MTTIGIDTISFYTSHHYVSLEDLALARNIAPEKYHIGLGQYQMSVPAPGEDVVTMAANAALRILDETNISQIDTVLFATESSVDQSKAAGIYLHRLLDLPKNCRVVELKQACYSATAALQMAGALVERYPDKKVLILASDIARYALHAPAEPTQGCGAVAFLVSANPRLLVLEKEYGIYTEDVMDFWRPNYCSEAFVEGKQSAIIYLRALEETWNDYANKSARSFSDLAACCYHTPLTKLVEKAHKLLSKIAGTETLTQEQLQQQLAAPLKYAHIIGNSYSAALYISLASLLENSENDLDNKRIGCYSYGSGCVGEYFSLLAQPNYRKTLYKTQHEQMLDNREKLSIEQYEQFYHFQLPKDGSEFYTPNYETGRFKLMGIKDHKRLYEKI